MKVWRIAKYTVAVLCLGLLLSALLLAGVVLTPTGTRWALQLASPWVKVQGIQGSIWHGLTVDQLRYEADNVAVHVAQLHLQVDWESLWLGRIQLKTLQAATLQVWPHALGNLPERGNAPKASAPIAQWLSPQAIAPYASSWHTLWSQLPSSPIPIHVQTLALKEWVLHTPTTVSGSTWQGAVQWGASLELALQGQLQVQHTQGQLHSSVHLTLTPALAQLAWHWLPDSQWKGQRLPLQWQLRWVDALHVDMHWPRPEGDWHWVSQWQLTPQGPQLTARWQGAGAGDIHVWAQGDQWQWHVAAEQWSLATLWPGTVIDGRLQGSLTVRPPISDHWADGLAQWQWSLALSDRSRLWSQPLSGSMQVSLQGLPASQALEHHPFPFSLTQSVGHWQWGQNQLQWQGALGHADHVLRLRVDAPQLAPLHPDINAKVLIDATLSGDIFTHQAQVAMQWLPFNATPLQMQGKLQGQWRDLRAYGWLGELSDFSVQWQWPKEASYHWQQQTPMTISVIPHDQEGQWQWSLSDSRWQLRLPNGQHAQLWLQSAAGQGAQWAQQGQLQGLAIDHALWSQWQTALQAQPSFQQGGIERPRLSEAPLVLNAQWDLQFNHALNGHLRLWRASGNLPLPQGWPTDDLQLQLQWQPQAGDRSQLQAHGVLAGERGQFRMNGYVDWQAYRPQLETAQAQMQVDIADLAWVGALTGQPIALGGRLQSRLQLRPHADYGVWVTGETVAQGLRIHHSDTGLRLIDGHLQAQWQGDRVVLKQLHFPSIVRVPPVERRIKQWLKDNAIQTEDGLWLSGQWHLHQQKGQAKLRLQRYPLVQRSDRFVMLSGQLDVDAMLPALDLSGRFAVDAGWTQLDLAGGPPSLDSDVLILRSDQLPPEPKSSALLPALDIQLHLGSRFYVVGLGLNTALTGDLRLVQQDHRLQAQGLLHTQDGQVQAYGQRLQINKGEVAFSGPLSNPVLQIEAVRKGKAVEAGVRVEGTAKQPTIKLISSPEVSDAEKLSWLIMGRGPDSSTADLGLLLSVGGSFLGSEHDEPFYRKLGLEDIGLKAGSVGASSSLLPDFTIGDLSAYRGQESASQIFYATRRFGEKWQLSLEQALSGSGTVLRASYRLLPSLSADIKVGTLNGLSLVYKKRFE